MKQFRKSELIQKNEIRCKKIYKDVHFQTHKTKMLQTVIQPEFLDESVSLIL